MNTDTLSGLYGLMLQGGSIETVFGFFNVAHPHTDNGHYPPEGHKMEQIELFAHYLRIAGYCLIAAAVLMAWVKLRHP